MVPRRNLHCPAIVILATGMLSVGPTGIFAQSTTAVCDSGFGWMTNGLNQTPCLVSAYLQGACNGSQYTIRALRPGTQYKGPSADQINKCQCSSVTYNTMSACGLCQNATIITWSTWHTNCTTVYPDVFPPGTPEGTKIPQWAYQNVTASNKFNETLAKSNSSSVAPTSAVSSTASSSSSSSDTGAIAGGVTGGVVGVALIAAAVVYFVMKKKRSKVLPSAEYADRPTSSAYPSSGYTGTTLLAPQMAQPKLYDPSDPSTFPVSPPPTAIGVSSNNVQNPIVNHSSHSVHPGYYSGAPEV